MPEPVLSGSQYHQKNGDPESRAAQPDMKSFMRMMDVASELRKQREAAGEQFEIEKTREDLRNRLRATAEVTGENLSDAEIDAAIGSFFSGLYRFKQPEKGFQHKLARLYVARRKILKVLAVPALLIAFLFTGLWSVNKSWEVSRTSRAESEVEDQVDKLVARRIVAEKKLEILQTKVAVSKAAETSSLKAMLNKALQTNLAIDPYFKRYTKNARSSSAIDSSNMKLAEVETPEIAKQLGIFENELEKSEELLLQLGRLELLPEEIENLYESVKTLAKEPEAQQRIASLYDEAKAIEKSADIEGLEKIASQLKRMQLFLSQAYKVHVVSRPGVKSGIDRFFTDSKGRRTSGYYLVLEARDDQGKIVSKDIFNAETGKTTKVSLWAEAVPKSVYDKVKQDKLDNGIVDENLFALKNRGELSEKVLFPGAKDSQRRQITSW